MSETFIAQVEHYRQKAFTVALAIPEPYRLSLQALIGRLLAEGASIDEARTATRRLCSTWQVTPQAQE